VGVACGSAFSCRFRVTEYVNYEQGLHFTFSSKCVQAFRMFYKQRLTYIEITKTSNCYLADGFNIGKAKRSEIIALFGLPAGWENTSYIRYEDKKIAFHFNKDSVVKEITLFDGFY
jgi:hypothetical protein